MNKTQESVGGGSPVWITQSLLIQINLLCVYIVDGRRNPGVYVVSRVGEGNRRDMFTVYRGFLLFCLYCRWVTESWGVCSKPCGGGGGNRRDMFTVHRGFLLFCLY